MVIVLIIQNLYVFLYLPVLLVSGVITGYGTGFLASLLSSRIKQVPGIL
ncbi:MAG: hypothetical protein PHH79_07505 [Aminobacterium colombiense]|nr:hypothetical protein [Aminobacterium colombiense]